ncbi:MAG: transposase [Thermosynechococcaceae cyanobacterium]
MSKKRRQYSPEFKSKIAIACIRGDKTSAQLAAQYEIHPTQVNTWKRELLVNASTLFDNGKSADKAQSDAKTETDELYRQIGKLKVERDFLAERSAQLGLLPEKPW